jgi:putative sigma-54 modulation protein
MKITFTGKPEALTPVENRKLERKLAKLSKLLDRAQGEAEAHVILAGQRHLLRAEITVRYHDHPLVSEASSTDAFTAITEAADKLEKQILKIRTKWRDTKRGPKQEPAAAPAPQAPAVKRAAPAAQKRKPAAPEPETEEQAQVMRVNHHERRKPMTVDEAMLEIDTRDYVVYRDAATGRTSVLIRRPDGNFDLIEA